MATSRAPCGCLHTPPWPLGSSMPGGGGVPGRHFQVLLQERCVLSAPPPVASQISIRTQGNLFHPWFPHFHLAMWPYLAALSDYRVRNRASSAMIALML